MWPRSGERGIGEEGYKAGLRNVDAPRDIMKESIEEAGLATAHELERYLTTLGTIASPF